MSKLDGKQEGGTRSTIGKKGKRKEAKKLIKGVGEKYKTTAGNKGNRKETQDHYGGKNWKGEQPTVPTTQLRQEIINCPREGRGRTI